MNRRSPFALLAVLALNASLLAPPALGAEKVGAFLGAKESPAPSWFKESFLDLAEDVAEAAARDKRVLLYFHQAGCPYCARLIEHNFGQKDIVEKTRKHFDTVMINMWGDKEVVTVGEKSYTEKELATALRVNYTPTLIFFDEQGKVALRINGYYPPENFRVALNFVADRLEKSQSFRDYFAAQRPTPTSGTIKAEPFFASPPYDLSPAAAQHENRVLLFEQKRCADCDRLHDKILKDPATRKLMQRFEVIQLDMWSDSPITNANGELTTASALARSLGVTFAPSMVFFDSQGREIMRVEAFLRRFHLQSVFDYVLTRSYPSEPSFQRYISARAEHLRAQGVDVDIWQD